MVEQIIAYSFSNNFIRGMKVKFIAYSAAKSQCVIEIVEFMRRDCVRDSVWTRAIDIRIKSTWSRVLEVWKKSVWTEHMRLSREQEWYR